MGEVCGVWCVAEGLGEGLRYGEVSFFFYALSQLPPAPLELRPQRDSVWTAPPALISQATSHRARSSSMLTQVRCDIDGIACMMTALTQNGID
jgi:hypothetical protein